MSGRVYLDWNATAPLRAEARAAMAAAWELCGNPSSVHAEGRKARRLVEESRAALGAAVGSGPKGVIFTASGTEANALALSPGVGAAARGPVARLLVSAVEHASVLAGGRFAPATVETIAVTTSGVVDLDHLRALLGAGAPALVSIMAANNETGALQPVAEAASLVHAAGGLLHVDAVQALGKSPLNIKEIGADLMTLSAHKIGGPKGVGALIVADDVAPSPLLCGGGQELGRRAGTENVAGIAGFAAAARTAVAAQAAEAHHMRRLQSRLELGLRQTEGVIVFCEDTPRLPNTTLFSAPGLRAETAVIGFDLAGIAVSSGSACSSGKVQPSHVLQAMGRAHQLAQGAVRLSVGWSTSEAEIDCCVETWRKLARTLLKGDDETLLERF